MTIAAALLLAVGCGLGARTASWALRLERASGVIEALHAQGPAEGALPVTVAFDDAAGRRHRVRTVAHPGMVMAGQPDVTVIYDPANPGGTARVDSLWRIWMWPGLLVAGGMLVMAMRDRRPEQRGVPA